MSKTWYKTREIERADKAHLMRLHLALNAANTRLRRDDCGMWIIYGRDINYISTNSDGGSWLAYLALPERPKAWTFAKRKFLAIGCAIFQDGDDEGVVRIDALPTLAAAATIRDLLGIRQRGAIPAHGGQHLMPRTSN